MLITPVRVPTRSFRRHTRYCTHRRTCAALDVLAKTSRGHDGRSDFFRKSSASAARPIFRPGGEIVPEEIARAMYERARTPVWVIFPNRFEPTVDVGPRHTTDLIADSADRLRGRHLFCAHPTAAKNKKYFFYPIQPAINNRRLINTLFRWRYKTNFHENSDSLRSLYERDTYTCT